MEASDVPDLKIEKRKGVVNILAVDNSGKGSVGQLVIILRPSPHVSSADLSSMKVNQGQSFADTRNYNDAAIRFAIRKLIERGQN